MKALALWKEFDNPTDNHTDTKPACNISFTSEAEKKMEQVIKKLGKWTRMGSRGTAWEFMWNFTCKKLKTKICGFFFSLSGIWNKSIINIFYDMCMDVLKVHILLYVEIYIDFLKLFSPMAVVDLIRHMANDTCCVFNQIDKLVLLWSMIINKINFYFLTCHIWNT